MTNSADRRVRRTRSNLRQALEILLQTKNIHDITVTELCEVCDINRSTFYLHYTDSLQLLRSIEEEVLTEFEKILKTFYDFTSFGLSSPNDSMIIMFKFLGKNSGMARALLCHNADSDTMDHIKEIVRKNLMPGYEKVTNSSKEGLPSYAFNFIVSGCIGMLQQWLLSDMSISPEEMAVMMETVLAKGIAALL